MLRGLVIGGAALAAVATVGVRAARERWDRASSALAARIVAAADTAARTGTPVDRVTPDALASLPLPVQRYFASAAPEGTPVIRVARLESAGTFRQIAPGDGRGPEEGWIPFTATQTFTADPPGFVWAARMRMMPLLDVDVRDGYADGRGSMRGAVLGLWTVVDAHGDAALDSGALLRWLAESPWLPTALLPGPRLAWRALDDTRARATVRDGPTEVSAVFEFSPDGDIVSVTAERQMAVPSGYVLAGWQGRFWDHQARDGMRIPLRGEVSWMLDGGWRPYWRGQIGRTAYQVSASKAARP